MEQWATALASLLFGTLGPLTARVVAALVVVVVAWRLATATRSWFERVSARTRADVNVRVLVGRALYLSVLIFGLVWSLDVFGVSPAMLITALGVLGLAASLALQDILKNFCAGIYLLFERPFRIGDDIGVRDFHGQVVDIGIRTTSLRTDEALLIMIPNAVVLAEVVINRTDFRPATEDTGAATPGD